MASETETLIKEEKFNIAKLSAMLEEYKALRTENVEAQKFRFMITGIGITALSAAASWGIKDNNPLILIFFIPAVCYLVWRQYFLESYRLRRQGWYLSKLENKINEYCKLDVLEWHLAYRANIATRTKVKKRFSHFPKYKYECKQLTWPRENYYEVTLLFIAILNTIFFAWNN